MNEPAVAGSDLRGGRGGGALSSSAPDLVTVDHAGHPARLAA